MPNCPQEYFHLNRGLLKAESLRDSRDIVEAEGEGACVHVCVADLVSAGLASSEKQVLTSGPARGGPQV